MKETRIKPDAYTRLGFQKFSEEIHISSGSIQASDINVKLRTAKVINFAEAYLKVNPQRVFEIPRASSVAIIVAVAAPLKCIIDERFYNRASLEGLGPLAEGAGPLLACHPDFPDGAITVATHLMSEHGHAATLHHYLWKIIKNQAVKSLAILPHMDVLEGRKLFAFAKLT
ncbi:MAG TPA: hypothetical protein VIR98_03085 [Candidatus Paceibacterota bacterium]|jgi:hypothetical protein